MVRAFVLLALGGADGGHAPRGHAPCRVLYARLFGTPDPGTLDPGTPDPGTPPRQRLRRKEQLAAVARQVASQHHLLQSTSGRPLSPQPPQLPDDPLSLQDAPAGLFQLPPGDPFSQRLTVTWLSALSVAFALVCDPGENLALAEMTLRRLAARLLVTLRLLGPGADVLLRADAIDVLLDRLLPHGEMLFLNEWVLRDVDRELGLKISH
ncbi:AP5S1 protein, partial [Bucorvus abyssinicus]|nr:AP5S1 protein [Bucorvus abyssinicus]